MNNKIKKCYVVKHTMRSNRNVHVYYIKSDHVLISVVVVYIVQLQTIATSGIYR